MGWNRMTDSKISNLNGHKLTAKTDVPDFRDYRYQPALINLEPALDPPADLFIRDQGSEGACTGFALAAVIDRLIVESRNVSGGHHINVSARMLYEMARRYDEWTDEELEGSSCRGAIKGWYNMGVCEESLYPYDQTQSKGYTLEAAKDARNNTIGAYYRLGSRISDYHAALNEVGAIYCSANVHKGWKSPDKKTGLITSEKEIEGGHAFAIVGYDQIGFWIQNSWGTRWGKKGTALWTYEDWLQNVKDAWVFRMGLPTPQIWNLPSRANVNVSADKKAPDPTRGEIAGHFVHTNNGKFSDKGPYWSNLEDTNITADWVAQSDKYDHLLLYAHGGLNSPAASARRIAAMKETWKANRVYPYHVMYDTGLLQALKDVVTGQRRKAEVRAGGLKDWLDKIVEKLTRVPGRAMWREMKSDAERPFLQDWAGSQTLAAFFSAFEKSGKPVKVHLAGHSTGMILLCYLLNSLAKIAPELKIDSVSLMAPAGTLDLFSSHLQPLLEAPTSGLHIAEMAMYNLTDELEQDDEVTNAYNKSLLYLVSRAFEEEIPARIMGMQKYSRLLERRKIPRFSIYYSKGRDARARVTESETHGGFDNDPLTMNHILKRVLKTTGDIPVSEFTKDNLDY